MEDASDNTHNQPIETKKKISVWFWLMGFFMVLGGLAFFLYSLVTYNQTDIIVEWSTASELDTVGFNLLRGESAAGPFARISPSIIPSSSDSLTGGSYEYQDPSARPGITYYYLLEEIETGGTSAQHGPVEVTAHRSQPYEVIIGFLIFIGGLAYLIVLQRDNAQNNSSTDHE